MYVQIKNLIIQSELPNELTTIRDLLSLLYPTRFKLKIFK